jgi:radical SAM superfamily enzyme YgiQ (UPF0313 family)
MSEYRGVSLLPFFSCAPVEKVPEFIFDYLSPQVEQVNGLAVKAPYAGRKVQACLAEKFGDDQVVFAHPSSVHEVIGEDTEVVGVSAMDPLGLAPVSMMFTYGGLFTAYTKKKFMDVVQRVNSVRNHGRRIKLMVGGPGAWQLQVRDEDRRQLKIDHIIMGETEHVVSDVFQNVIDGDAAEDIMVKGYPDITTIPLISKPSIHGIVEVMRGCGRNCEFCDPNLRAARYMPIEKILQEISVNTKIGYGRVWLHSEDIFLYKLEDHRNFMPNRDALYDLFGSIMSAPGIVHVNPTHGTVAPPAADPELFARLSQILRAGPDHLIGVQSGLETGSTRLIADYMPLKCKPFQPSEWADTVFEGTRVWNENYWFPAFTLIIGLPGETEEDSWETVRLIDRLERKLPDKVGVKAHFTVTPLSFIPLGVLKDKEFYDIGKNMTEGQFHVIYRAWRHTVLEVEKMPGHLMRTTPYMKVILRLITRFGSRAILSSIEKWGRSLGYDHERGLYVMASAR